MTTRLAAASGLLALFTACQPDAKITLEGTVVAQEQPGAISRGCSGSVQTITFPVETIYGQRTIEVYPEEDDPHAMPVIRFLAEEVIEPGARVEIYGVLWEDIREDDILSVSSRAISAFSRYYPLEGETR